MPQKGPINFSIEVKGEGLSRRGVLETQNGVIQTPAFAAVGTKGTVKSLTPEHIKEAQTQVVLSNTYHLYLQPGEKVVQKLGGLKKIMNWGGPTMTDSGGFQVFSLGAAYGKNITKFTGEVAREEDLTLYDEQVASDHGKLAIIDEEGVTFTSHLNGTLHRFTPERSIEIQHCLGADMIFAFDECTSPTATREYQSEAMERTHKWAIRSLKAHRGNVEAGKKQALFGIVQGGREEDLRKSSAEFMAGKDFDGYGIGGSFSKADIKASLSLVNAILPENKPRHLLGIGEPEDLLLGVEQGVDLFDCVAPTRRARGASLYTKVGIMNILHASHAEVSGPIEDDCECYTCKNFSRGYVNHLYRANEMLSATLGSIHNIYFINNLMAGMREALEKGTFKSYKDTFLKTYKNGDFA